VIVLDTHAWIWWVSDPARLGKKARRELALPRVELLALTPAVAVKAAELPATFSGDRADRLIAATAVIESAALVTRDARMSGFAGIRAVWS
jgi:PIN domain nuclease of toxin-antitoxin system